MLLIILMLINSVLSQPSPCPKVFAHETKGEKDQWYGRITLTTREKLSGIRLRIELDSPALFLGSQIWSGNSTIKDNLNFLIKNRNYILDSRNEPFSIRFFVTFDPKEGVPSILRITLNGQVVCSSNEVTMPHPVLHMNDTKVKTTTSASTTADSFFSGDSFPNQRPFVTKPTKPAVSDQCGTLNIEARPLIIYGQSTTEGKWPWHAAIYRYNAANMEYRCGGSLISRNHVLTVSHCVTKLKTNIVINQELFLIHLGKYNLYKHDESVQTMGITKITIHPEYNASYLHNDIAILHLERPAEITDFVRFVCLWEEDVNLSSVINTLGTIVGWGFDGTHYTSETLMQAEIPVVSTETCIFSNRDFFSRFTSDKTYCAGFRNGTAACTGDSGGGMVFSKADGKNLIWQLRGIISLSVASQDEKVVCDTSHYMVFTDVAKHLGWIHSIIDH